MKKLTIDLPPLVDLEGGKLVLNPTDTPGAGASALVLSHDATNK
jgi:hypothetical protein